MQASTQTGDTGGSAAAPATEQARGGDGLFDRYTRFFDRKVEELAERELWGITAQLPKGLLKVGYEYTNATARWFFDRDGNKVPLTPDIEFTDFPEVGDHLVIAPRVEGHGGEHKLQASYGITDPLDFFIEIPFVTVNTDLELNMAKNGEPLSDLESGAFRSFLQANGRPLPGADFSGTDIGDIKTALSWNFYRSQRLSTALTGNLFLPTGTRADANNDITFLLGPEIDRGEGAWAINLTSGFDYRPINWLIFSFEVQTTYRFGYDREAPTWLPITDCARLLDPADRDQHCSASSPAYDAAYDIDQSMFFPDMTELGDTFHVEAGLGTGFQAGMIFDFQVAGLQLTWQFDRTEAPTYRAQGEAGAAFEQLTRNLEMLGASEVHTVGIGAQIPALFLLRVPIMLRPSFRYIVSGKNTIRLDDQFGLGMELFLPFDEVF